MQPCGWFIEDEKIPLFRLVAATVGQVPDEPEPLRFAAGQSVEQLTESQITESNLLQDEERPCQRLRFSQRGEKLHRFAHRKLKHFVNRAPCQLDLLYVRLETPPFALRATHIEIAQELHLDLLETGAATPFATDAAGIEGESARGQALRHRVGQSREALPHPVINAEVKNRRRTWSAGKRRLINHHDLTDAVRPGYALAGARFLATRPAGAKQIPIKHFMDESRFPGTRDTSNAS